MNNDIIFYYKNKTENVRKLIDTLTVTYPYAKFKQHSGSVDSLSKQVTFITSMAWLIDIEVQGWDRTLHTMYFLFSTMKIMLIKI